MSQAKQRVLALFIALAVSLTAALPPAMAATAGSANGLPVSAHQQDDKGPGKGNDGKGKADKGNDDKGKANKGKDDKGNGNRGGAANNGNTGNGQGDSAGVTDARNGATPPGRAFGLWWRAFRSRWLGGPAGDDLGGWQLGRFKDAFPFAHPAGWQARERGDAFVMLGPWQGGEYVFQMTRTAQVGEESLRDWVESDLNRLGMPDDTARFAEAGRTQVAVVTGVNDSAHNCPVAYVYLWTQNPAGRNQRQAVGVIAQRDGATCDPAALDAFVNQYLARIGAGPLPLPLVTPTAPGATATPAPTAAPAFTPLPTPGQAGAGWQRTRFFNAFSFVYPAGWAMDRLGDTAHLQGRYGGRDYVMDIVWVRSTPQSGLEQWVRADLADLGALEGTRLDYIQQPGAQIAIAPGVRMAGYACPVVRFYVIAENPAGDGPRAFAGTLAQANGATCDPAALEELAYIMLQQA
jgi:hypothetical protein